MQLLGFKDKNCLKVYHNLRGSYFFYPDDKKIQGSSQASDALIKEMIRKDKIGIVKFAPRENTRGWRYGWTGTQVRICAIIP